MIVEAKRVRYVGRDYSVAVKYSRATDDWLVFLHGLGCAKECFDPAYGTELAERYSILTFDFVGFGDSDKPDDFAYSMEDHANIAELLIGQFNPKKIVLAAHSMGGTVGLLLAGKLGNLVSLINTEGNLIPEDAGIVSRQTAEQAEEVFLMEGFDEFLGKLETAGDPSFRTWAEWYGKSGRLAVHRSGSSLVEWSDSGRLLAYFNSLYKKAYVYGDRADNDFLLRQIKGADIISIPNSGHFMMLDNPQAFYAAIKKSLGLSRQVSGEWRFEHNALVSYTVICCYQYASGSGMPNNLPKMSAGAAAEY